MNNTYLAIIVAALIMVSARPALAIDRIDSPGVEQGQFEMEYHGIRLSDPRSDKNDIQEHEVTVAYTPTERWGTEVTGHFSKDSSSDIEMSGIEWLNTFQFFEPDEYWLNSGATISYTAATIRDEPDAVEVRLLLEKDWGKFTHTANIGFSQDVGSNADGGPDLVALWRSVYHYTEHFAPGFEIQNDFGKTSDHLSFNEQEHYAGPGIYGSIGKHVEYEAAALFGLTDASSLCAVRLLLNYHTKL